jgi:hypothetical protein
MSRDIRDPFGNILSRSEHGTAPSRFMRIISYKRNGWFHLIATLPLI